MTTKHPDGDALFLQAEQMAHDFSLFPRREDPAKGLTGLLRREDVETYLNDLRELDVDAYIARTVQPSEDKSRLDARKVLRRLKGKFLLQGEEGPLYWAEVILECDGRERRFGVLAQNRSENNGVWMPQHHLSAVRAIRGFTQRKLPIVTLIDTPGADAGEVANATNQAHSISHLIAEMAQIDVPCVGIVLGGGYSGGAIPLATVNILLSVRDGVFNTIQPQGLANIVRKYGLSWQECARFVGVSAYELYEQGYIDGIIDYVPGERDKLENLRQAIFSSVDYIEQTATTFVRQHPMVFEHYARSMERYLMPVEDLKRLQAVSTLSRSESPTSHPNIFGLAYRYLRYLRLRQRIRSRSMDSYGRLSDLEMPTGDLKKRAEEERKAAFDDWQKNPLELRYEDKLLKAWRVFRLRRRGLSDSRGRLRRLMFRSPEEQYEEATARLCMEYGLYLYNLWKSKSPGHFRTLIAYLSQESEVGEQKEDTQMTMMDVLRQDGVRQKFIEECESLLIFDAVYNEIINSLRDVAKEASESNVIAEASVRTLLDSAMRGAARTCVKEGMFPDTPEDEVEGRLRSQYRGWVRRFIDYAGCEEALKGIESWKKQAFPRLSETLFAIVTFFCYHLMPQCIGAGKEGQVFDGRIRPRNIGIKDFWHRLAVAYRDLLIQDVLSRQKREARVTPESIIDRFFSEFQELNGKLMTADPVSFPGFRQSIEEAVAKGIKPCGLVTGIGRFRGGSHNPVMGVAVSNLNFQAGAFDMASAEKFCALLRECMLRDLPVVCFISSSGMQTKEGAGALFSMPIVNDRLTRFIRDQNLPVICFGFGDCTGGAQASFVTHPLVQTYYLSGTNMPFAGQIVVPSYLPSTATLSNYLSTVDGSMRGLVKNPFWTSVDRELEAIDARMPLPQETIEEVVGRVLEGRFVTEDEQDDGVDPGVTCPIRPIRRLLVHARGCSAAKLVRKAQDHHIQVVLVQSDADSDSAVAGLLTANDQLVCIGGNTPDESYLNATSIIRIAEQEKVDA
ncbi:MAG: carbamoyl-phosphate synthase large subunit, partial [Verrucomicrobia bacterium]|nr:carbamoyl-phosphate synthase large subunit [Verrucomicrobiota bacterium]